MSALQVAADDPKAIDDGTFERLADDLVVRLGEVGTPAERAVFARFVGVVAADENRPDLGQAVVEAALGDAEIPRAELPHLWFLLGQIHADASRRQEARNSYARAEAAWAEAGSEDSGKAEFLRSLYSCRGEVELALGLLERAARSFAAEARQAAKAGPAEVAIARFHGIALRLALEEFDEVRRLAREGLAEIDAREAAGGPLPEDPMHRAFLMLRQGIALSEMARGSGDPAKARQHVEESLVVLRRVRAQAAELITGHLVLVDIGLRGRDPKLVREALGRARSEFASVPADALIELRARLAAFEVAAELDVGDGSRLPQARDALRDALEAWFRAWEREPVQRDGVGFLQWGTQRLLVSEAIRAELATGEDATRKARALAVVLRAQQLGTLSRSLGLPAPDPEGLRARLMRAGTGALVLLPAMERTHAFVLDERGIDHFELPSRDTLLQAGNKLMTRMLVPVGGDDPVQRAEALDSARGKLSGLVLGPELAARISSWRRCLCTGNELLPDVPLDVLTFPDGREIGLEMSISHLPSLAIALELLDRADARPFDLSASQTSVLVATQPSPAARRISPRLAPIPLGPAALADLLDGIPSDLVWYGSPGSATMSTLTEARVAAGERLVLFAHGIYDASSDHPAQLALEAGPSDDGIASATFFADPARTWPPEVLLLACGTARGSSRLGDDTATHLGAAFLERGACAVLVSRGDLDLSTATGFARSYLEHAIVGGEDAGESMRLARRRLASRPETADLARRGLFMLYGVAAPKPPRGAGSGERTASSAEPAVMPAVAVAAVLAVVLLAWGWRRRNQLRERRS